MSKQQTLKEYSDYKRTSVKSIEKLKDIERYISNFINSSKKELNKFDEKDLINFLNSISDRYSISSLNSIKAYIKNFIKWKFEDYSKRFRNLDKLCRTEGAEQTYQPEEMLSKKDVEKLVQAEHDLKWKTFWLVYFYSGCRPSEVCNLKWTDITFEKEGAFIKIFSKKNKKTFDKFVPENVSFYLKKLKANNSEWVFPSVKDYRKNLPMKSKAVYFRLIDLSQKVLGKKVNPYILRHSVATLLYNDDKIDDDDVARQLGHTKNMKKTYNNLSEKKIKERARKIWIRPDDLPSEKKHELELKVESLKSTLRDVVKMLREHQKILKKPLEVKGR